MPPAEENELYALNWSYFDKNLKDAVSNFESNTDFTDVTFVCQEKTIHAHRFVLHAGSDFFRDFFKNNPIKNPIFVMYHVKSLVLQKILKFLYHGEVQVEKRNLEEFIHLAENLKIKGIASGKGSTKETIDEEISTTKQSGKRKKPHSISLMRKKKTRETEKTLEKVASSSDESAEEEKDKEEEQKDQTIDKDQLENEKSNDFLVKDVKEDNCNSTGLQPEKFLNRSLTRYKRLVSSIEKDSDIDTHILLKGTRRRCGQCSIQKIEKRTCYYCKKCDIGLCITCFKPFHDVFDEPKVE